MSDETCSRGVTLEIDEDETSSLSSMEETATVRTARGVEKRSKQLQFGYEGKKVETISQQPISPAKNRSNASSLQLPTHNVYKNSEQSSSSNIRSINQPAHPYEQIERQKGPSNGLNRRSSTRSNIPSAQASASSSDNTSSNRNRDVAIFEPIHSSGTFC